MKVIETRANGSIRVRTVNNEPSRTQQSAKDACDINHIMRKYKATGHLTHLNQKPGMYMDLTEIKDYQGSLDKILKAKESFMTLPAETRKRFGNDPGVMLEFLSDERNIDESVRLGLRLPKAKVSAEAAKAAAAKVGDQVEMDVKGK